MSVPVKEILGRKKIIGNLDFVENGNFIRGSTEALFSRGLWSKFTAKYTLWGPIIVKLQYLRR